MAHECSQGSAPNPGIDLCCFLYGDSRTNKDTRTKSYVHGVSTPTKTRSTKFVRKTIADTSTSLAILQMETQDEPEEEKATELQADRIP